MNTQKTPVETKFLIVKEVLSGNSVTEIAKKYHVNRSSVYRWLNRTEKVIMNSFFPPRKKQNSLTRENKLREEASFLKRKLGTKSDQIRLLKEELQNVSDPRPPRCKICGCEKMYKNGIHYISLEKLILAKKSYYKEKIPVQRFICPVCNKSAYLDLPLNLWHWVHSKQK